MARRSATLLTLAFVCAGMLIAVPTLLVLTGRPGEETRIGDDGVFSDLTGGGSGGQGGGPPPGTPVFPPSTPGPAAPAGGGAVPPADGDAEPTGTGGGEPGPSVAAPAPAGTEQTGTAPPTAAGTTGSSTATPRSSAPPAGAGPSGAPAEDEDGILPTVPPLLPEDPLGSGGGALGDTTGRTGLGG